ncbi:MAG TPA: hypothetical protein VF233_04215 [Nitrososphaeraceae archaeon]
MYAYRDRALSVVPKAGGHFGEALMPVVQHSTFPSGKVTNIINF